MYRAMHVFVLHFFWDPCDLEDVRLLVSGLYFPFGYYSHDPEGCSELAQVCGLSSERVNRQIMAPAAVVYR